MSCASRKKVPGCVPDVRIEVSRAAWSKHWRQCVWLTCPTPTRDMLASRCCRRTARKLPRCGTCGRAKSTYCDLSSFGPALFEIWWPDIYLGGPYGPVKDKMYWPELARRSKKFAAPAGQCLCRGLWFRVKRDIGAINFSHVIQHLFGGWGWLKKYWTMFFITLWTY